MWQLGGRSIDNFETPPLAIAREMCWRIADGLLMAQFQCDSLEVFDLIIPVVPEKHYRIASRIVYFFPLPSPGEAWAPF